ncbi:astakine-like isoform X2 [Uloborus diversus]|uniref:astakine-like isoform X2 n=1 Tax=Uloborus diversus TaxID=327109 RepID=UPI00240A5E50|nr:astakine-like isoform X2 [Uloborus diversus]
MQLSLFLGMVLTLCLQIKTSEAANCSQADPSCPSNLCCSNVNGSVRCRNLESKNTLCNPRMGSVVYINYCPCRVGLSCSQNSNRCRA